MYDFGSKETRIVLMSPELMKLYEVQPTDESWDHQPITFYNPQECLDMMIEMDYELDFCDDEGSPESKACRIEKQWGELELRLSFFMNAYKWQ